MTHALIAVDQRGGGGALEHCDGGARIERAALELAHVAGQAKHAVRVLSGEVGLQHGVSDHVGILLRQSARAQGIFQERAQGRGRDTAGALGFGFGQH